jgi:type I restriction enzyme S subunit
MKAELKPYPAYKPSENPWIGEIPSDWDEWRLRFTAPLQGGFAFPSSEFSFEGIPVVRMTNLKRGAVDLTDAACIPSGPERFALRPHDLLLGMSGSIGETGSLGNYAEVSEDDVPCFLNQRVGRFLPKANLDRTFLKYLLQSKLFTEPLIVDVTGTAQFNISPGQVGNIRAPLPDKPTQAQIATFLDRETAKIDRLMEVRRKQVEQLQEQRTAVIHHAVTRGLDPNAKMKPSGHPWLEEIPAHWKTYRLKFLSKLNPTKSNSGYHPTDSEKVVFLPMECVSADGRIDQSNRERICDLWKGFTYFARGDVLVAKITPCFENGKGALVSPLETEIGFGTTEFHVIRAGRKLVREFLYLITASYRFRGIGERFMTGAAGQQRVSEGFIADFPIALPPELEQQAIVDYVVAETDRLDTLAAKYRCELELLAEYRASLISHAVTGKIDVRDLVPPATNERP